MTSGRFTVVSLVVLVLSACNETPPGAYYNLTPSQIEQLQVQVSQGDIKAVWRLYNYYQIADGGVQIEKITALEHAGAQIGNPKAQYMYGLRLRSKGRLAESDYWVACAALQNDLGALAMHVEKLSKEKEMSCPKSPRNRPRNM